MFGAIIWCLSHVNDLFHTMGMHAEEILLMNHRLGKTFNMKFALKEEDSESSPFRSPLCEIEQTSSRFGTRINAKKE